MSTARREQLCSLLCSFELRRSSSGSAARQNGCLAHGTPPGPRLSAPLRKGNVKSKIETAIVNYGVVLLARFLKIVYFRDKSCFMKVLSLEEKVLLLLATYTLSLALDTWWSDSRNLNCTPVLFISNRQSPQRELNRHEPSYSKHVCAAIFFRKRCCVNLSENMR